MSLLGKSQPHCSLKAPSVGDPPSGLWPSRGNAQLAVQFCNVPRGTILLINAFPILGKGVLQEPALALKGLPGVLRVFHESDFLSDEPC